MMSFFLPLLLAIAIPILMIVGGFGEKMSIGHIFNGRVRFFL